MAEPSAVGARIRAARLQRGFSQRTLAGLAGLSPGFIGMLETGERQLQRRDHLLALADALSVSPAELVGEPVSHDVSISAAHAAIPALRLALMGCPPQPSSVPDLAELTDLANESTRLYHACEYGRLAPMLPGLLGALSAALEGAAGEQRRILRRLQLRVYQPACVLLCKVLGYTDLAWITLDRAAEAAAEIGDPLGQALSGFYKTHVLLAAGAVDPALDAARSAEQRVAGELNGAAGLALYGELHLITATTLSARKGASAADVADHLNEAAGAAARTGETRAHGLNFGPTNLAMHRLSTAVDLGEFGQAVDHAAGVDPFGIDAPGRQAAFFGNLSRALSHQRGREAEAVAALLRAESIASQRVHADPLLVGTVGALAGRRLPERAAQDVRKLAGRMGLPG